MNINDIVADLAAFADDAEDVAIDTDGSFALMRGGEVITGKLITSADGAIAVETDDGTRKSYRQFLMRDVAQLNLFAERLLAKRPVSEPYIDGPAILDTATRGRTEDRSLPLLEGDCRETSPFATRIIFVTADAGHGKTMLLRNFQHRQAERYLQGTAPYLFWHVDLQGRQLLRLSEALMGDLADLRISGLWMPAIIRLIRHHGIVLGIDGFDELAAEQGNNDALGALALIMSQLEGHGVVVAASRRTFFDTEDYLSRAGLFRRALSSPSEFDQLALCPWTRAEGIALLEQSAESLEAPAGDTYGQIVAQLGGDEDHPMLTRPFLLSQVVRGLVLYGLSPAEFIRGLDDPLQGVAAVVKAFVEREVSDKWRSKDTGEPYLSFDQHMELLSVVADEMYRSQRDRLGLDVIETLTAILVDQWGVDAGRRQQVLAMVRMHVLLTVPADGRTDTRGFDHTEFRDYFVGYALRDHLRGLASGEATAAFTRFLSIAQITDSTALYVCGMLDLSDDEMARAVGALARAVRAEWKPTHLQTNAGTLLGYMLRSRAFTTEVVFDAAAIVSSLALEHSILRTVRFRRCTLMRASLLSVQWTNATFENCDLGELTLDENSRFENVVFIQCSVDAVVTQRDGEEVEREYAPSRIRRLLEGRGIIFQGDEEQLELATEPESEILKHVRRFVRMFNRTTVVTDAMIKMKFRQNLPQVYDSILPLLERHGVVEEKDWHGARNQRIWSLRVLLDDLLSAEEPGSASPLTKMWKEARRL